MSATQAPPGGTVSAVTSLEMLELEGDLPFGLGAEGFVDLGEEHLLRRWIGVVDAHDRRWFGFTLFHRCGAEWAPVSVPVAGLPADDGSRPAWRMVADLPGLTLDPDVRCPACGDRGVVRDGMWVPQ